MTHAPVLRNFLLNEEYPSLLYEITQGATSVWEAMQAVMPDGTKNAVSFIQPPFCSVGNWMVQSMGGIRPLEVDGVYAEIGSGRYLFEYNENVGAAEGVPGVSGQLI